MELVLLLLTELAELVQHQLLTELQQVDLVAVERELLLVLLLVDLLVMAEEQEVQRILVVQQLQEQQTQAVAVEALEAQLVALEEREL